jgi:hypothetical protein
MYHVASLTAAETLADAPGGRDTERRRLIVVKGTQPGVVNPSFAKGYKIAHDFFNAGCIQDAVYGTLINHFDKKNCKIWTKVRKNSESTQPIEVKEFRYQL